LIHVSYFFEPAEGLFGFGDCRIDQPPRNAEEVAQLRRKIKERMPVDIVGEVTIIAMTRLG
jgi:hypothetical protein